MGKPDIRDGVVEYPPQGEVPTRPIVSQETLELYRQYFDGAQLLSGIKIIEDKYVPPGTMYFIQPNAIMRNIVEPVQETLWGKIARHYWVETIVGVLVAIYAIKALFFDNEPIDAVVGTITGVLAMFGINYGLPGSKKAVGMYSSMEYTGER